MSDREKTAASEAAEQAALLEWAGRMVWRWPELRLLYHVPNGGSRRPAEAARLKTQGVKPGVPDLCLPVARGKWHGLYIEMKTQKGRLSPTQRAWLAALEGEGYRAVVCRGWKQAREELEEYLGGEGGGC